ncbi:alpha-D-ribose 1-methylphosphonate 5-triphosphate diphosphatase [Acidithiobacillus sp. CV18-2]|uniref:Alpha-D-ribose 1-methylphosphonate 5-triphosphate diphosphatase n=1 Tax=Igneacidithiobacillus copahuensis TaxID=2724909 RepID=A0AAE2YS55_9PROT|nr:alpha-D-ribose 1-methylphosphonate 5-triphosphate diphosphatase [Igneacidithiobacillus copahuensis]MBU2755787.1 alpha-D-ribose 1-methylphosphonate 5-triphosphate diphosphatase [Acidithiobacillus sp. CV18-3]MBU2757745.1 alpha-D-ribose 1-methylphosphonate 5-triphosphate diphosphatase [Acidithiobacillus sp. BN09-2]MBU2777400.1 alpha-D-ribose 1-methylphosphonate 5-triphosphate diphosphatase [Acidithiobacillus sp. CV18-2]MBU2796166.1 alpha-D-ribose 1-methylphosphonate 5-triphosphate diphosphatase
MKIRGFRNARLVLPDEVVLGSLLLDDDGKIRILDEGPSSSSELLDCAGDFLLPGLVDIHTDNLERQVQPRTQARWPSRSAFLAHDAQCIAAGITSVADALCVGDAGFEAQRVQTLRDALVDLQQLRAGDQLRAEHFLHLRCELPVANLPQLLQESLAAGPVQMLSLMDHTPGVGQHTNLEKFRSGRRAEGLSEEELEQRIAESQERHHRYSAQNRAFILELLRDRPLPVASHDDVTPEEIERNARDGIRISEFPVTLAAARHAVDLGMATVAGAPNLVRGGSHSGNVAVADLVREGVVSALASDYYPSSLLEAAFLLAEQKLASLPQAIAMVTSSPARLLGLEDRGSMTPGQRADLLRGRYQDGLVTLRGVWRAGERVG